MIKKDCGFHYGKTGGKCQKCSNDPNLARIVQHRLKYPSLYGYDIKRLEKQKKNNNESTRAI